MNAQKRGRPRRYPDEACQRIVEWKKLKDLCRELGVPLKSAERLRTKYRQVFQ